MDSADAPTRADPSAGVRVRLEHVGIAVESLAAALERWAALLPAAASSRETVESQGVELAFVETDGARLELLESVDEDGAVGRFLKKRGPGVHHLSFLVDGVAIEDWFETLRRRGVRVLGNGPMPGAGGKRIFFVHPESTGGVLVEFSSAAEGKP
jgi:methylmalonyl-CoA epimerase